MSAIYLGQSLAYRGNVPAIFLGRTAKKDFLFLIDRTKTGGKIEEQADYTAIFVDYLRQDDPTSPSGKSIYYGSLHKKLMGTNFKLKRPKEEDLKKEFEKIRKLLNN